MESFTPQLPIVDTIVRTALIYLAVCVVMRVVPKRHAGSISPKDMVGAVIVGGVAAIGIAGHGAGAADVLLMVSVVLTLNFALDWLAARVPLLRRVIHEPHTRLIRAGEILRPALRREMLTEEELLAQLRKHGVENVSRVRGAYLEANGEVSVVIAAGGQSRPTTPPTPAERTGES